MIRQINYSDKILSVKNTFLTKYVFNLYAPRNRHDLNIFNIINNNIFNFLLTQYLFYVIIFDITRTGH